MVQEFVQLGFLFPTNPDPMEKKTRGRLARKHFSTGAHPAAEPPFYIAAASVSACGNAQCVWSHESSISSSYFPLELRRAISHESGLRKLHCSAQVALCKLLRASALCKLLCASALSKLLCASALRQLLRASALRMCSAQVGLCKLLCACSVQVALRKCSEQAALRKGSAPVAPRKRFAHVLCTSWSVQVALRKCFVQLLCASCSAQVALRK